LSLMKSKNRFRQVGWIVCAVALSTVIAHYDRILPHWWHSYTGADGTYSIELPASPSVETLHVPIDGGGTRDVDFVSASPTSQTTYSCVTFKNDNAGNESTDDVLASARDGSLGKVQGTLISEKKITVGGFPAIEFQAHARGNSLLDSRIVATGSHLFMIAAVATQPGDREARTVKRFLESFKILSAKENR